MDVRNYLEKVMKNNLTQTTDRRDKPICSCLAKSTGKDKEKTTPLEYDQECTVHCIYTDYREPLCDFTERQVTKHGVLHGC
jgi:hypothetical protein